MSSSLRSDRKFFVVVRNLFFFFQALDLENSAQIGLTLLIGVTVTLSVVRDGWIICKTGSEMGECLYRFCFTTLAWLVLSNVGQNIYLVHSFRG